MDWTLRTLRVSSKMSRPCGNLMMGMKKNAALPLGVIAEDGLSLLFSPSGESSSGLFRLDERRSVK